ncbi:hypothetical protein BRADI_5g01630v3 [Brachypodium distachyon]|uniref:Uncharacterized protein n=1 Tax=Brachypodium distachyon TaxID=15368 RepID=A0A0Q3GLF4_BRADI|nr:hypothetical protein BRADI_5g01630v3 [Brachypodium distachyon]
MVLQRPTNHEDGAMNDYLAVNDYVAYVNNNLDYVDHVYDYLSRTTTSSKSTTSSTSRRRTCPRNKDLRGQVDRAPA